MGQDINGIRLQLLAKRLGVDFKDVITIGRQELHLTDKQLQKECVVFGIPFDMGKIVRNDSRYSE